MQSIYDLNYDQMQEFAQSCGWKSFRGHQIFQWLYRQRAASFDEMSNLS
ncbi:MAG TPA: 23S rRNA (adenine(2503)-C(2))-methyltransferase RlmN, partial [Erysipelotrichaceae bacterium]|nr:23S rRNA (adenine(2503)-C(2))-methyltransferase RlmN [Erysipelotrichaceae bacterium]